MARNKPAKKHPMKDPSFRSIKPEYYPVQLSYQLGAISEGPFSPAPWFHSVPRALSEVNHRLMRTGRRYTLKVDIDNDAAVEGNSIDVYALVDTWWVANAFASARAAYETAMAEERATLNKNQMARWQDFVPENGFASQIAGSFLANTSFTQRRRDEGEHVLTQVVDAAGVTRTFTWSPTPAATQYSIVNEYDNMGNVDDTPENSVAGGYATLKDDINSVELNVLQTSGDLPPYNRTSTVGSNDNILVKIATLELSGSGSKRLSTGFFNAPCGYIWLAGVGATFPDGKITVTCKAGNYKGTHALSMGE